MMIEPTGLSKQEMYYQVVQVFANPKPSMQPELPLLDVATKFLRQGEFRAAVVIGNSLRERRLRR